MTGSRGNAAEKDGGWLSPIRSPNSRRLCSEDAHLEQDETFFVGYRKLEVGGVPEMLGNVPQHITRVPDSLALRGMNAGKVVAFVILNVLLSGIVRVDEESRHGAATYALPLSCQT